MRKLINNLSFELGSQIVGFFKVDFPLLSPQSIVLEPGGPFIFLFATGLIEVVLNFFLHCIPESEVLHEKILVNRYFLQDFLNLGLVEKIDFGAFGSDVVDLIDLLLQLR